MKRCPECGHGRAYRLNDGRLKCRACGRRFSWTSVWDSVRLPTPTKRRLLEYFALGVPSYRQRFASDTSDVSRERFYRLLRACCAKAEQLSKPFEAIFECDGNANLRTHEGGRSGNRRVVVVGLVNHQGRIRAHPVPDGDSRSLLRGIGLAEHDEGVRVPDASQGYALLRVRGESVTIRGEKAWRLGRSRIDGIDGFWSHARMSMHSYRAVPRQYFHLYLAEACYRYNHREEDLAPLLLGLMKTLSIQELRPVLGRNA